VTVHPILELVGEIQADLSRANARFTALRAHLAAENLEPVILPVCDICGPLHMPPATTLEDHRFNLHGKETA
jgi:hypothetical protein